MPSEENDLFDRIAHMIEGAQSIAVAGHTDPDGDALGSVLGLVHLVELRWPGRSVQPLLANDRPLPPQYGFLPGSERFVPAARYNEVPDVFIALDTPCPARLRDAEAVFARARATACIDHHPSEGPFADVSVVRPQAASAGDMVYDFMVHLGVEPTADLATCLLTAILTDTGRYQYQNTDTHALLASAAMIEAGASPAQIATAVYQSCSLGAMHLKAVAMQRLEVGGGGDVAFSYVTQGDIARVGATDEDCDSLIDVVRALAGVKACVFMREQRDGDIRGNLRSKVDGLDVSAVARQFGGGGHRAAAGFTCHGPIEEAVKTAVDLVARQIELDGVAG